MPHRWLKALQVVVRSGTWAVLQRRLLKLKASKTHLVRGSWGDLWLSGLARKTSRRGPGRILPSRDTGCGVGRGSVPQSGRNVKLFVQPEAGLEPILAAIGKAKKCIQILI